MAGTVTATAGGASITVTADGTGAISYSYQITGGGSIDCRRTDGNGVVPTYADVIVTRLVSSNASNSGTATRTAGGWLMVTAKSFDNTIVDRKWVQLFDTVHEVSVSPSSPTIRVGQVANLTASGGQNGYVWSATNGGSLLYDGDTAAFTAGAAAVYIVQVYSPGGGGYSESNYATATITVTPAEKVSVKLPKNDSGRPIEYTIFAGGVLVGQETQNIGAPEKVVTKTLPPEVPSGTQAQLFAKVVGILQDETTGTWTEVQGAVTQIPITTLTPSTDEAPAPVTVTKPNLPDATGPTTSDQAGKGVWSSAGTTAGLSDSAYKEGVDKTTAALAKINKTLEDRIGSGSGGGGTGETTGDVADAGTHERLDTIAEKMDTEAQMHQDLRDANPTTSQMNSAGDSAGANEAGKVPQLDGPGSLSTSGAAPVFAVALPAAFGGRVFDLNPFQSERFASIAAWHRKACEWLAIVLFGVWCSVEAGKMVRGVNTANQAKGNTVVAGTGGQATSLIAAGLITVVVAIALVAIGAFATTNLGGGTLLGMIDDDPFSGLLGGTVWMMDQLFPLGAIVSCFVGRLVWQAAAQTAYVTAAAAIRFIVP